VNFKLAACDVLSH